MEESIEERAIVIFPDIKCILLEIFALPHCVQNFLGDHYLHIKEPPRINSISSYMAEPLTEVYCYPDMIVLSVPQLVGLLKDKNPVVRQLALENLLPYTQSGNPHLDVWKTNNWEGGRMLKILTRDRNVLPPREVGANNRRQRHHNKL
jgi:hypothetical protein